MNEGPIASWVRVGLVGLEGASTGRRSGTLGESLSDLAIPSLAIRERRGADATHVAHRRLESLVHQADEVKKKQLQRYQLLVRANALHREKVARHERKLEEERAQALARTASAEALKQERTRKKLSHQVLNIFSLCRSLRATVGCWYAHTDASSNSSRTEVFDACGQAHESAAHDAAANKADELYKELQKRLTEAEERAAQALQQRQAERAALRRQYLDMQQQRQTLMQEHQ